jgi:hypothetical protein
VWLGGTLLLLKFQALLGDATSVVEAGGELAHCWVLRRHLVGCCSRYRSRPGRPNARGFSCGGGVGVGVWLCVECCIVDASILLWSSV